MTEEFMIRALLAGIGIALTAGPLGVFVVWRHMAYFGDALSHAALLGVALGLLTGIGVNPGILIICIIMAGLIAWLQTHTTLATDTSLGILSHTALALGLATLTLIGGMRLDLMAYLFGDILASDWQDVIWIYAGGATALIIFIYLWRDLLNITVHEGLAQVDGVAVARTRFLFMLLVALTVANAFKIVGALLVTALLIIPAAAARPLSRSPIAMAAIATGFGIASVLLGLTTSYYWDLPSGPAIVLAAFLFFVATLSIRGKNG